MNSLGSGSEPPQLQHLFSLRLTTGKAFSTRGGPQGGRVAVDVTGGTFEGERLKGTVPEAPGGDWITQRQDGSVKLDVRIVLQTDDGATILMTYNGIGARYDDVLQLRTAPLFETGDERYAWLNNVQAVGSGRSEGGVVEYEIYALT